MLGRGLESLIPVSQGAKNQTDDKSLVSNSQSQAQEQDIKTGTKLNESSEKKELKPVPSESDLSKIEQEKKPFLPRIPGVLGNNDVLRSEPTQNSSAEKQISPKSFISAKEKEAVFLIEVEKIKPNPYQPRRDFNEGELKELAHSIREFGIIQPLLVSKIDKETEFGADVEYQLIAGERRLRAAKLVGLERVPVIIKRTDEKKTHLELALIENLQRANLNPLEAARAYARLQDEFNLTQREIAGRVGKSREAVANALRLLSLPSYIQEALNKNEIGESQARILLSIEDFNEQKRVFHQILEEKITVRRLREKVSHAPDPERNFLERQLEEKLGAPVQISKRGNKGKLVIKFFSEEEMRGVLSRLLGEETI